jgi:hypothetical protein
VRAAVIAALTLLVFEAGVRAIDSSLPEINAWREPMVAAKVKQMDALRVKGRTDVVFGGSSQMLYAGDPAMLKSLRVPWNAYNAAFWGAPPVVNEHWLTEVVVPRLRPKTVIMGVSPIDFIEPVGDAAQTYFASAAVRDDWLGRIERRISSTSALVRHRRGLRSPKAVYEAVIRRLRGQPGPHMASAGIDAAGRLPCCDGFSFNPEAVDVATKEILDEVERSGWPLSDAQLEAFKGTVTTLRSQGAEVLLVDMAISAPLIDLLGRDEYRDYRKFLRQQARSLEVPVIDMAGGLDRTTFFFDYDHLNRAGANVFNTAVARVLASGTPGSLGAAVEGLPPEPLARAVVSDVVAKEQELAEARAKVPAAELPAVAPPVPGALVPTATPPVVVPPLPTELPRVVP